MLPRRTAQSVLAWTLPWLVARLLLPAGVMPAVVGGEPGWILCSAAAHGDVPRPAAPHDTGSSQHAAAPCPFAAAAACAPPPAPALAAAIEVVVTAPAAGDPGLSRPRQAVRAHPARGPPFLS
ncbi:MAG: hypothetical protein U1F06_02530 [Steroidobacteraceae bacterium]